MQHNLPNCCMDANKTQQFLARGRGFFHALGGQGHKKRRRLAQSKAP